MAVESRVRGRKQRESGVSGWKTLVGVEDRG